MIEDENNANQREFDRLQGQIDDLTDIVATLVERAAGTPESEAAAPWSWRATTGERREALWGELTRWVEWHNERYGRVNPDWTIHPCWFRHPAVVEHLTALMVAWRAAYESDKPSREAAIWHDQMNSIHIRMTGAAWGFKNCAGGHREPAEQPTDSDPEALAAHIAADVQAHPDTVPAVSSLRLAQS